MIEVFKVAQRSYQIKLRWRWLGSRHSRAEPLAFPGNSLGSRGQSCMETAPAERGLGGLESSCCSQVTFTPAPSFLNITAGTHPFIPSVLSPGCSHPPQQRCPSLRKIPDNSWPSVPSPPQEAPAKPGAVLRACPFSAFLPCSSLPGVFPASPSLLCHLEFSAAPATPKPRQPSVTFRAAGVVSLD